MKKKGFTLIELSVVAGIIVILTAVTLASYSGFRGDLAVQREASKMSLILRKAQTYALAVREFNAGAGYQDDPFCANPPVRFPPYGASFSTVAGGVGDQRSKQAYIIFGDSSCDSDYTVVLPDGSNEQVEVLNMGNGVEIKTLKGFNGSSCNGCLLERMSAVYQRPTPTIMLSGSNGATTYSDLTSLEVTLEIPGHGFSKKIIITLAGQVAIE